MITFTKDQQTIYSVRRFDSETRAFVRHYGGLTAITQVNIWMYCRKSCYAAFTPVGNKGGGVSEFIYSSFTHSPKVWLRFVDDVFSIVKKAKSKISSVI